MEPRERIAIAKAKMESLVDSLRTLLQVRANNEFVLSREFKDQVGKSYAANAFNILCGAVYEFELVKMCALWDVARNVQEAQYRNSIPAIAWLIDDSDTIAMIRAERVSESSKGEMGAPNDELLKWLQERQAQVAKEEGAKVVERALLVQSKVREIQASDLLVNLKNFRDKHIAHSLVQTALERKKGQVDVPLYGHEKELLEKSIAVASDLYYIVCDASYAWDMAWEISRRYSAALLSKCEFRITE